MYISIVIQMRKAPSVLSTLPNLVLGELTNFRYFDSQTNVPLSYTFNYFHSIYRVTNTPKTISKFTFKLFEF